MSANPLKDLSAARPTEIVEVGGKKIIVVGLSSGDISQLMTRFPAIISQIMRAVSTGAVDPEVLVREVPAAIPPIIAAGFRKMGDAETEADAGALSLDDAIAFIEKIIVATMPAGPGPLVERLRVAAERFAGGAEAVTSAKK
jgi:hypothetical protein